jgi:hypothetical protein
MIALAAVFLQITIAPSVPAPDGQFKVTVTGLRAPAASVVVHGGVASRGRMFGLVPLRRSAPGSWWTVLRAPGFYGAYPIRVRAGGEYTESGTVLAVLPRGFNQAPSGLTTHEAIRAWAEANGATVSAMQTWRAGFYYHRDQRYNRLVRASYTSAGTSHVGWFNLVRTAQFNRWRVAELVAAP